MAQPNPYLLACDNPSALLELLRSNPAIASSQDEHGYSLLHAASSYGHLDLLRALVKEFNVNANLLDEDGENCLFVAETPKVARCLVEELGVDYNKTNDDGYKAHEKMEADDEFPQVVAYLREVSGAPAAADSSGGPLNAPPPVPGNMQVNIGTMSEQEANAGEMEVDPEFKRRIDELAAREDFNSAATQEQLRDLVMDALSGSSIETADRETRRRVE